MNSLLDSRLLRTFILVADCASITQAAQSMHVTQSAASAQIRRLEEQLGCRLFERTTRSVTLTQRGAILLGYARNIVGLQEQAVMRLGAKRRVKTKVRVGCSEGFASDWLFAALVELRLERPDIHVEVTSDISVTLAHQCARGELDMVVGAFCDEQTGDEVLWTEPLMWVFASDARLDPSQPLPLAFLSEPCPYREVALAALSTCDTQWQIEMTARSARTLLEASAAGLVVTAITSSAMGACLKPILDEAVLPALPTVYFVIRHARCDKSAGAKAVAHRIRDACFRWRGTCP